jgi:glycosyltransferase involved in cell wall biosynthesis
METTSISIIIPTYKSPQMLDLCLKSAIEGQVYKNQILVIVDGFYDLNKEVLEKYKEHIDILNLEENVGLCRATNLGVYNAQYDKLLIVNDDNIFPRNWDVKLSGKFQQGWVWTPNQIEPHPSMFKQFIIKDLGQSVDNFDLDKFWEYEQSISHDKVEFNGSTLPIFMSKLDYLKIGGWDENYEQGMVADWDFFLKCSLNGYNMVRTYNCHFYHFASVSVNGEKRQYAERAGHEYAKYKWGSYIQHTPENNLKFLSF